MVGIVAMAIIGKTNYERFRGAARIALIGSIILLVIVLIPGVGTGKLTHGAQRWIRMGPLQFQPSELAKVGVILYFADSISKKRDRMATFREGILPYVGILATIAILMGLEPHLSGMVLLLGIGAVMMYVGGIRNYWVFAGFVVVAFVAYAFATGLITYNSSRISIWLDPFNEEWMRDVYKRQCYAFGQNFNVTPVALLAAQCACVNGGYLYTPYLVEEITDQDGNVVSRHDATPIRQVISAETSALVRNIMEYEVTTCLLYTSGHLRRLRCGARRTAAEIRHHLSRSALRQRPSGAGDGEDRLV